jgi:putative transposase
VRRYRSYHTVIKQLVKRNSLPEEFAIEIDRSTLWRWKQEGTDKYFGFELSNIELWEQFLKRREAGKVMRTYLRIASSLSGIMNRSLQLRNILKANLKQFVDTVICCKNKLIIKLILRLCKVRLSVVYFWKSRVLNKCLTSPLQLCRKRYPEQLTSQEVTEMKSMLTDVKCRFWPVSSIAYYALRENINLVSLATWYLYKRKLCIDRIPVPIKEKHSTGLRASYPDQIWHADITIIRTMDCIKHNVYLLMDNFSRFILSWRIEEVVSVRIRVETIREAYKKYHDKNIITTLITYGGPENDINEMDRFILNETTGLNSAVALRTFHFRTP